MATVVAKVARTLPPSTELAPEWRESRYCLRPGVFLPGWV